jgi:hypothetical protein
MLVVGGERDGFSDLFMAKMIPKNMLKEEMRLQGLSTGFSSEAELTNTGGESEHSKG